jgi:hypothetical protein
VIEVHINEFYGSQSLVRFCLRLLGTLDVMGSQEEALLLFILVTQKVMGGPRLCLGGRSPISTIHGTKPMAIVVD